MEARLRPALDLDEASAALHDEAVRFARAALAHDLPPGGHEHDFIRAAWKKCADFGLFTLALPKEHGGGGAPLANLVVVMEALGYACRDQGLLFSLNAHLWTALMPLVQFGSDTQKRDLCGPLADGTCIAANATTESGAGSDVCALRTLARRHGESYVLSGEKCFVTNAPIADVFVIYATIDPALGAMGLTAFLVRRGTPGLSVTRTHEKMGLSTSPMADVVLEDCVVPTSARLGREGRGLEIFEHSMEWERGLILAPALGVMRRLVERCVEHARTRRQFGQPIGKNQAVSHKIADMKIRLDACRPLVYRVARLKEEGRPTLLESAVAKLQVSESYVRTCMDALQIFGASGYMADLGIERELRDALASTLYSGTSEIQRNIVAKSLGL
jgi:alkylation response protein AidB-like acyl-CoA dehydrogenase